MDEPNNNSQPVILTYPNSVSLTLGIVGVVIGVFGLLAGWIPYLGAASIPAGLIGFLLSGIGVGFACFKKFRSIELPVLGCFLCISAISLSIWSTYHAEALSRKTVEIEERQKQAQLEAKRKAEQDAEIQREKELALKKQQRLAHLTFDLNYLISITNSQRIALYSAQTNLAFFKAEYDKFFSEKPYLTNAVYKRIVAKLKSDQMLQNGYAQSIPVMGSQIQNSMSYNPRDQAGGARSAFIGQQSQNIQAASDTVYALNNTIKTEREQLQSIIDNAAYFHSARLDKAQEQYDSATRDLNQSISSIASLSRQLDQNN